MLMGFDVAIKIPRLKITGNTFKPLTVSCGINVSVGGIYQGVKMLFLCVRRVTLQTFKFFVITQQVTYLGQVVVSVQDHKDRGFVSAPYHNVWVVPEALRSLSKPR